MEIKTKPKIFKGFHMWYSVDNGVILVEKKRTHRTIMGTIM